MLILARKPNQEIVITGGIRIVVTSVKGQVVRLGVEAPRGVVIKRAELGEWKGKDAA